MIIKNVVLTDLDGNALKQQDRADVMPGPGTPDLTVARVLLMAALAQSRDKPYEPGVAAERYKLALALNSVHTGDDIQLSAEMVVDLKKDVLHMFAPLVSGQVCELLDA